MRDYWFRVIKLLAITPYFEKDNPYNYNIKRLKSHKRITHNASLNIIQNIQCMKKGIEIQWTPSRNENVVLFVKKGSEHPSTHTRRQIMYQLMG